MSAPDIPAGRADLIRRLYPVSITTGFAAVLGRTLFGTAQGHHVDLMDVVQANWRFLTMLFVSLVTVLASWDGYQAAIARTPLVDRARFYLDIAIVFLQLLLLQAADLWSVWYALFALLYGAFIVWDLLRLRVIRQQPDHAVPASFGAGSIAISAVWFALALLLSFGKDTGSDRAFVLSVAAALTITLLYRIDKRHRFSVRLARGAGLAPA